MYAAATGALAREIFGKHKADLLAATVVIPAAGLLARGYFSTRAHVDPVLATPLGVVMLCSLSLLLCSFFAYVDLTARASSPGFPRHILVLPLPTWLLALVPIATGSLFISMFALLWLRFISGPDLDGVRQLAVASGITAMLCWIQAMSWRLIRQRYVRLLTLALVLTFAALGLVSSLTDDTHFLFGRTGGALVLLATIVSGYGLAYLAVIRSRHGDTALSASYAGRLRVSRAARSSSRGTRVPPLRDGAAAQKWFEWRAFGPLMPAGTLLFGSLIVLLSVFGRIRALASTVQLGMMGFLFLMIAPLAGVAFAAKSPDAPRVELGSFRAALPLADFELACAKLSLAIRSHFLSLMIVLAVATTVLLTSHDNKAVVTVWANLQAAQGSAGALLGVLLCVFLAAVITWDVAVYTMSLWLFIAALDWRKQGWKIAVIGVLAFAGLLKLGVVLYQSQSRGAVPAWLESTHLTTVLPAAVTLALGLALLPRFRALNRLSDLRGAAAICGAALVACVVLLWQLDLSLGYRWALSWLAVTAALLTFISFLLVPVVIGLHRHR